ncbi:MAG: MBG domain-containing protein [Eubacteriales bacterium]|nr:MBG domain-containing protein [Eubacteriales bacterium]
MKKLNLIVKYSLVFTILVAMLCCALACEVTNSVTITYMNGDTVLHQETLQGVITYVPDVEGFAFEGWFLDKDFTQPVEGSALSGEVKLYAKLSQKQYVVKFYDYDGSVLLVDGQEQQLVLHGESAVAPEVPNRQDYVFIGWSTAFDCIKSDIDVFATYAQGEKTVRFLDFNGAPILEKQLKVGTELAIFANTAQEAMLEDILNGFVFDYWQLGEQTVEFDENLIVTTDATYKAVLKLAPIAGSVQLSVDNALYQYSPEASAMFEANVNQYDGISYTYSWKLDGNLIDEQNDDTLSLVGLIVGRHNIEVTVVASAEGMEPVEGQTSIRVNVQNGTLTCISAADKQVIYNANSHGIDVEGLQQGDQVVYRLQGEEEFSSNLNLTNVGTYMVQFKVSRRYYNDYVCTEPVKLQITPATLDVKINDFEIQYGDALPTYTYQVDGLLGNDQDVIYGDFIYGGPVNSLSSGQYDITMTGIKADNYTLNIIKGKLTIAKRDLTITVKNEEVTYGDKKPSYSIESCQGFISGDSLSSLDGSADFACDYIQGSDVGEYAITLSGYVSDNYNIQYSHAKLTVNKKDLTVKALDKEVVYGDTVSSYALQYNGFVLGQDESVLGGNVIAQCDYRVGSNVGEYIISVSGLVSNNYAISYQNGKLTVNPKKMTITPNNKTVTYGDPVPTLEYEIDGLIEQDKNDFGVSLFTNYEQGNGAGNYSIDILPRNDFNYDITYKTAALTVNKKDLTIAPKNTTITYGDARPQFELDAQGFVSGDSLSSLDGSASFTCTYTQGSNAGAYEVTVRGYSSRNYNIRYTPAKLTVNKKGLTIAPIDTTITYGDARPQFELDVQGLITGDSLSSLGGSASFDCEYTQGSNAGEYNITVDGYYSDNYDILFGTATLSVQQREITLSMNNEAVVQHEAYSVSASELNVSGAYGAILVEGVLQATNNLAGVYTAVGDLGENFEWKQALKFTLESVDVTENYIVKYNISLILTENSFVYSAVGVDKAYDGVASQISVTTELPTSVITYSTDGENYSAVNPSFVNAGQYTVYYLISDSEGIYDSVSGSQIVKIAKANLTIIVADEEIVYGEEEPSYSIEKCQGFISGDSLSSLDGSASFTCDYTQGLNVGEYPISANGFASDNYNIRYQNGKLTVNPKKMTITPNNKTVTYGDPVPTLEYKIDGLIEQDKNDFVVSLLTDYEQGNAVGSYVIKISPIDNANYAITYNTAVMTVNKKALTITIEDATMTYGDAVPNFEAQFDGLIEQDQASFVVNISTDYEQSKGVGIYNVTLLSCNDINYEITCNTAVLTVNKKTLTITPNNVNVEYGDSAVYSVQYDGFVSGENAGNLTGTLVVGSDYVVGDNANQTFVITASGLTSNNYNIVFEETTLTVQPKNITLAWSGTQTTYYYNEQDQSSSVKAQYTNAIGGASEYATIIFSGRADKFLWVGDYQATAVVNDNYAVTNAVVSLTMNKGNYDVSTIAVPTINGVYGPNNVISAQPYDALPTFFTWKTPNVIPVCADKSMTAIYCADSDNYNAVEIQVPIVVQKATVSLKDTMYEQDYVSGEVMTINPVITYNSAPLNSSVSYDLTITANNFTQAGTYKFVVKFSADNYAMTDTTCYAKFKGIAIGSTLYTIEDAIKTATSGTIIVKYNASFAPASFSREVYPTDDYFTIKSGVTLLVPYDGNYSTAMDDCNDTATGLSSGAYCTLTVPTGINLAVNGTINVNGMRSHQSTKYMGHTIYYGQLILQQGSYISLNNGSVFNSTGYTTGKGFIDAKSGSNVYETLAIKDFRGGGVTYKVYETMFPFSQYVMQNIESDLRIHYGAFMYARYYMYPSTAVKGAMPVIGSGALFQLGTDSYIDKTLDNSTNKTSITLHGTMDTNYAQMTIKVKIVITYTLNVSTQNMEFPFPGNYIIKIASGSVANINNRFKLLPAAQIIVEQGAQLNVNDGGRIYAYGSGYDFTRDIYNNGVQCNYNGTNMSGNMITKNNSCYNYTDNARLVVDGTLTLGSGGYIGGCIYSNGGGTLVLAHANSSTIKDYYSATKGSLDVTPKITYYDKTFDLQANTASGQVTLSAGTYTSTGNVWA